MLLRDYLSENPVAMLSGCLVWIPVAIWVMAMIHWMIQGDLDVVSGFVGSTMAIVCGFFTMKPPNPALSPLFLAAVLAVVVMFPFVRNTLEHRAHVQIDVDLLERAYKGLDEKPGNFGSRWKIAQVLYVRGLAGHAAAIAEDLLKGADERVFYEELRQVARWKESLRPDQLRSLPCLECNQLNTPGQLYCKRCKGKYLLDYARGRWFGHRSVRRLISVWVAAVGGLVGVPTAATALKPTTSLIVVPLLLVISVLIIWRSYVAQRQAEAA